MHLPLKHKQQHGDARTLAQRPAYASLESDEEIALGWECANPALQIDSWEEETALDPPCAVY